ncbi:MAG: hypothetical protein WCE21_01000 [Candidatus Babeliales bacterium]
MKKVLFLLLLFTCCAKQSLYAYTFTIHNETNRPIDIRLMIGRDGNNFTGILSEVGGTNNPLVIKAKGVDASLCLWRFQWKRHNTPQNPVPDSEYADIWVNSNELNDGPALYKRRGKRVRGFNCAIREFWVYDAWVNESGGEELISPEKKAAYKAKYQDTSPMRDDWFAQPGKSFQELRMRVAPNFILFE